MESVFSEYSLVTSVLFLVGPSAIQVEQYSNKLSEFQVHLKYSQLGPTALLLLRLERIYELYDCFACDTL